MYKCKVMWLFSVVIIICLFYLVDSSNIETINYARHNGSYKSMFGFSIATHREQGQSWILVGAPKEQDNYSGITNGGVVYKCNIHYDDSCEQIRFHQNTSEQVRALDDKENQWFGATISTAGPDGPVVACAPRYVWFTTSREERRDPVGTCYIAKDNFNTFSEYSPCRTSLFGYHRQGSCQAGFSAGISKDSRRLFIGAPGSWYWQGQSYSIDPSIKYPYTPGIFGEAFGFGTKGQIIQQNLDDRPAVVSTPESPATYDNSYMGYSMVVGDFNGAGIQGAAVGMPKGGKNLEGKVLLYTWDLTNYLNITGKQLGEYFGYSVATSDIDGDNRDDLIIGAPLHAEKNSEMKYEVGRVYIAYQGQNGSFAGMIFLDGFNSKSRFGLSVCGLGDLNLDTYGDFAVGAPYDGPNEQGAVYIFQGSANGVIKQYSQVIYAEDIQKSFSTFHYVETFGFSISGGLDLDGNDYPDMAVGAYLSDTSYFFRARPVVKVEAHLNFLANPKQIFLEQKNCLKPGDSFTMVPCIEMELCMRYTGIGTDPTMEFLLSYTLDTQIPGYSRMYFKDNGNKVVNTSIVLRKDDSLNCQTRRTVYLEDPLSDKLTELEIRVEYFLNQKKYYQTSRDPNSKLQSVLDSTYATVINDSISIYKNCGEDNICTPSLYLSVKKKFEKYVYQVGKQLQFEVKVINSEENSYGTKFFIGLPEGVTLTVVYRVTDEKNPISCKSVNETLYSCGIGDPLTKDTPMHFIVEVEPLGHQKILKPTYDFYMNVTSANPGRREDLVNQTRHVSVDVWVNAILNIHKKSIPKTIYYNISHEKSHESMNNETQQVVIHSYTVTNDGPSDVEEVEIFIVWPEETLSGQDLLYLLEQPHTLGGVTCEQVDVNSYNLPVHYLRDIWDIPEIKKHIFLMNNTQVFVENGTGRPGEIGDTKTKTITKVTFYDSNKNVVYNQELIGEPEWNEYWGNISAISTDFNEPLTIRTNQTTLVEKYVNEIKVSEKLVVRPDDPINNYTIMSNSTTVVQYYGPAKNLIFEEIVTAQPGSLDFKNLVQNTKDTHQGITSVVTTTTKHIRIENMEGKVIHEEILTQTGTESRTDPEISRTSIITYVTYYDQRHKLLYKEAFTIKPTTKTYWDEVNKYVSRFKEPVTIHTSTVKVVTYFKNGVEVRREEFPYSEVVEAPVSSHTEVNTVITITSIGGIILDKKVILGEDYSHHVNNMIEIYKEPVNVNVKTTYTITYKRADGKIVRIGTFIKDQTELVVPTQVETKTTSTITTVTIFDVHNKILHQENITESVDSKEYWEKLNKLIAEYNQPVTVTKKEQIIITYYINGKEVRKVPDVSVHVPDTSLSTHTDVKASIQIFNSTGNVIYVENLNKPVNEDHIKTLISRYREFITLKIKTISTIHYYDANGRVVQTGILTAERTVTHVPRQEENKVITTVTTVTVSDVHHNILYRENITDAPDSVGYWEKINKIISSYKEPVVIQKVTQTIITYYIEGVPVRTEPQGPATSGPVLSTNIDVASVVTVYNSRGNVIFEQPISGEVSSNQINEIVNRFRESISVNIKTTYVINYRSPDGRVMKTGTYVLQRTEKHDVKQNETQTTSTITTITFKDLSGNILLHENVTESPGSKEYWEKLTQLVSSFKKHVTIEVRTQTVITYYVDGHVIGTKLVDGSGVKETDFTTQSEVTSVVTVTNAHGATLHTETLARLVTNDDIQDLLRRFTETVTVNIQTTHHITYFNAEGRIVQIGTYVQKRTETHTRPTTQETSSVTTKTTIIFYDVHRNILHQEVIDDEPESPAYWRKVNEIITRFRKTVTVRVSVEKTITYFINGRAIRVEPMPVDTHPITYTSRTDVTTHIEIYGADGRKLYEQVITFEKGTPNYNSAITDLVRRFREPITVKTKSTYIITYRGLDGRVSHTETVTKEETETHNYQQQETEHVSTITVITFYDSYNTVIHQETVREEPGTRIYWDQIKLFIEKFNIPASIQTNTTKIITYTVNGREVRQEHRSENKGAFATPIVCETETLISYYDSANKFLHTEHAPGNLNNQELQVRVSAFGKNYNIASVQVHKTVTFRGSSGQIIHTFTLPFNHQVTIPGNHQTIIPGNHHQTSRTVTETTFIVYGSDRQRVLYTETITGEPGSESYNNVVSKILRAYPAPFTIYTNSTKTTTFYTQEGVQLNKQFENEARSTIQQEGGSPSNAKTTITFYGPNGETLHSDTIKGAPGADLQDRLREIATEFGGGVRSYGGFVNGGSIGGNVNFIDSPQTGSKPTLSPNQFNDFNARNFGPNHNNSQYEYYDEDDSGEGHNLNNEGLGAFAQGNGFRTGGLDFGTGNGGSADHYVDQQARNNFENYRAYDQDHNYLSSRSNSRSTREVNPKRSKREDKTDQDIKTLSNCATSKCLLIRCTSGPLSVGDEVHIAVRALVFIQTLKNISMTQPVTIQSSLLARVSKFQELSAPPVDRKLYSDKISTMIMAPQPDIKPDVVPLWVVVLSAVAGTLILLLLIFLLYMCGFFNRNRPSNAPERQPLNRNGHFNHGDEAL